MIPTRAIKLLSIAFITVALLLLFSFPRSAQKPEPIKDNPNNFNQVMSRQFNDNIREVAAKLERISNKIQRLESSQQELSKEQSSRDVSGAPALERDIQSIKEELLLLKHASSDVKSVNPLSPEMLPEGHIIDLDAEGASNSLSLINNPLDPKKSQNKPYFTIPAGSDFTQVQLLSALIGEVPEEGKLAQPLFPFSAIIDEGENITANGMALPDDLIGIKVGGLSIGVGSFIDNISCVRAYVTSMLFVFADGHFVTLGSESSQNDTSNISSSLGYLTSPYGNPCIKGDFITNAPALWSGLTLASGINGAGSALSDWQLSLQNPQESQSANVSSAMSHLIAGGAVKESSQNLAEWLERRTQGSFDMVFVAASHKVPGTFNTFQANHVNLHLTKTLNIDKNLQGRRLDYGNDATQVFDHALS